MTETKTRPSRKARAVSAGQAKVVRAFDAGRSQRRLRSMPTATQAINTQIRAYGKTVLARSRYLAANNPYAAAAKETFVSALVGSGIKPSSLATDANLKAEIQLVWNDWTDEADADGVTDLYGLQAIVAAEMFEAGECFVRLRSRFASDGLSVPLQLQVIPAEMLPLDKNQDFGVNGRRIECGIEFNGIGKRTAYHFLRRHPGSDLAQPAGKSEFTIVPADEILHLYKPIRAGQIRGLPHTLSAIAKLAIMDQYDDAELERKRVAALFSAFITKTAPESDPLGGETTPEDTEAETAPANSVGLEPGATVDLEPGESVLFGEPADVGGNYEAFQYRTLLAIAAGFGVPYAAMTGDLRQTSYGSIRAGLVEFRRRVEAMQWSVMIFQFCRPVWRRWLEEAVLDGALPLSPAEFLKQRRELMRVKWITPKWEWIDPLTDLQAEKLAVDNGFKSRGDVIEASGFDPEETDARIAEDQERAESLGLEFGDKAAAPPPQFPPKDNQADDGNDPPVDLTE